MLRADSGNNFICHLTRICLAQPVPSLDVRREFLPYRPKRHHYPPYPLFHGIGRIVVKSIEWNDETSEWEWKKRELGESLGRTGRSCSIRRGALVRELLPAWRS